jgi:hypothetical protein
MQDLVKGLMDYSESKSKRIITTIEVLNEVLSDMSMIIKEKMPK